MKYTLTACAILKNERRYILEWLAFHMAVGVEYFYLYDNDSDDDIQAFLAPLVAAGICEIKSWSRSMPLNAKQPQVNAYRDAFALHADVTEWMAVIDLDEFLVPLRGNSVRSLLKDQFASKDEIVVNWRLFGSAGLRTRDRNALVTEQFIRASTDDFPENANVKSIVRPSKITTGFIHEHTCHPDAAVCDSSGAEKKERGSQFIRPPVYDLLQVNHYYCKSYGEFLEKRVKGNASLDDNNPKALAAFEAHDQNGIEDLSALRFVGSTKVELQRLKEILRISDEHKISAVANKPIDEFTRIAIKHGTDKYGAHRYAPVYNRAFGHLRQCLLRILEIGIGGYDSPLAGGLGLNVLAEFFPLAKIVGLDIQHKRLRPHPRITTVQGSQVDTDVLERLWKEHGPFDIIIDDGSHIPHHMVDTFKFFFPLMLDGGIYVVEDTQTSLWPHIGGRADGANSIFELAHHISIAMHAAEARVAGGVPVYEELGLITQAVQVYRNLVIFERGDNDYPSNHLFDINHPNVKNTFQTIIQENELNPSPGSFLTRIDMLNWARQGDQAASLARTAMSFYPTNPDVLIYVCNLFKKLGLGPESRQAAELLTRALPGNVDAEQLLATQSA